MNTPKNMTVADLAAETGLELAQVQSVFDAVEAALLRGRPVRIPTFGTFERTVRKGRKKRTGVPCPGFLVMGDRFVIKYRMSRRLPDLLNPHPETQFTPDEDDEAGE